MRYYRQKQSGCMGGPLVKMEIKTDLPQMLKQWGEKIVMKLLGSVRVLPVELSCLPNRLLELVVCGGDIYCPGTRK